MNLVAHIDGSCEGNPGESGCGLVLQTEAGTVLEKWGWYLGRGTNNTAEYHGLLRCMETIQKYRVERVLVLSDSQLLVNQILGRYRVKNPRLAALHQTAVRLMGESGCQTDVRYVPREQNREADGLAKKAIRMKSDAHEILMHPPGA
ncbi:MAG TPA: ribonuclease HI family protein [bacterium]